MRAPALRRHQLHLPSALYLYARPAVGQHAPEDEEAVGAAEEGFAAALRVGHEPEDVAAFVDDAGDALQGAVGVRLGRHFTRRRAVTQDDAVLGVEAGEGLGVGVVVSLAVGDGHPEHVANLAGGGEGRARRLDAQVDALAAELGRDVAGEDTGQEAGLAEDLEAVAAADDELAAP